MKTDTSGFDHQFPSKISTYYEHNWDVLALAVIKLAIKDYKELYTKYYLTSLNPLPEDSAKNILERRRREELEKKLMEEREFFQSDWGEALIFLGTEGELETGEGIPSSIESQVKAEIDKKLRKKREKENRHENNRTG